MINLAIRLRVWYYPPSYPPEFVTDGVIVAIEGDRVTVWKYMTCYDTIRVDDIVSVVTRENDPDERFENARAGRLACGEIDNWKQRNGG